jgi:hypothetical protein
MPGQQPAGSKKMMGIGWAITLTILVVILLLAAFTSLSWALLGRPRLGQLHVLTPRQVGDILKFNGALVAGLGAVVALVLGYRRQKVSEAKQALDQQNLELVRKKQELDEATMALSRENTDAIAKREETKSRNERYVSAATQLGHESTAVRLAGAYAMAGLADDWSAERQACIDVLCGYLRMPPLDADHSEREKRVRHAIIGVIAKHLRKGADPDWQGNTFDFTGATFNGGSFQDVHLGPTTELDFTQVTFCDVISFVGMEVAGGYAWFGNISLSPGTNLLFFNAKVSGGWISFSQSHLTDGRIAFDGTNIEGGSIAFPIARLAGTAIDFANLLLDGGSLEIEKSTVSGGHVTFNGARLLRGELRIADITFRDKGLIDLSGVKQCDIELKLPKSKSIKAPPAR